MTALALLLLLGGLIYLQNVLYRRHGLEDLSYRCYLSRHEVFEGEELELIEELENRKFLPMPWLKSELTTSADLHFADSQAIETDRTRYVPSFFMLKARQKVRRRWFVTAGTFGVHPIEKTVLVASDLLGFVTDSRPVEIRDSVTVLPKPLDLEALHPEVRADFGELVVKRRLLTDPFFKAGVRPHQPGDDLKSIHWYATAREGQLMTFEEEATSDQQLAIIVNMQTRSRMVGYGENPGICRNLIRIAATAADLTLKVGLPVKVLANAERRTRTRVEVGVGGRFSVTEQRAAAADAAGQDGKQDREDATAHAETVRTDAMAGREHVLQMLRVLGTLTLAPSVQAPVYFADLLAHDRRTTDIMLVTHYLDPDLLAFLRRMSRRGVTTRIALTGPPPPNLALPPRCRIVPLYKYLSDRAHRARLDPEGGQHD